MSDSAGPGHNGLTYKDSGVDIDKGNRLVDIIKPLAKSTARLGVAGSIGGFGGLFDLKQAGFNDPILVSGTDGVGTKLEVAHEAGNHSTIGIDLVAMCVNDVLAQGAEPLFFLDYFACSKLELNIASQVIASIADGCHRAGCALIGGETAEMPGMYENKKYDLAGFCVAAVERSRILPRHDDMKAGDILIGLTSSGGHSNGYSLIRKVRELSGLEWQDICPWDESKTLAGAFLIPTRIYVKPLLPLIKEDLIKGLAHITGGGLTENTPRMLPLGLEAKIDYSSWEMPDMFKWLQNTGNIAIEEMRRTFNCGIGMVIAIAAKDKDEVLKALSAAGENPILIGELSSND